MTLVELRLGAAKAYLVRDRQAILVDTGWPGHAPTILRALRRAGVDARDVALILHTHGHIDHAGSTAALRRVIDAPIAVHSDDAQRMRRGVNGRLWPHDLEGRILLPLMPRRFEPVDPDLLVEDGRSLAEFGVAARIVHTPGHTSGSVSVLLDDGRAIVGDLLMGGRLGGMIAPSRPRAHYSVEDFGALHESLRRLLSFGPSTLHPGHGGPLRPEDVRARLAGPPARKRPR